MGKLPLSFLIFIFPFSLNAQKDSSNRKWAFSFTLASVPVPGNWLIAIQPGVGYQPNPHFLISAEVAFQTGRKNDPDSIFMEKKYVRIKPEIKYFFSDSKGFKDYFGVQFSYAIRSFISGKGYYYNHLPGDSVVHYDQARINSPIITSSIQLGSLMVVVRSFMLDFFIGAGLRSINTDYAETVNPQPGHRPKHLGGIPLTEPSYYYPGSQIRFQANFGIRILYFLCNN
jgi:hypothetical protein